VGWKKKQMKNTSQMVHNILETSVNLKPEGYRHVPVYDAAIYPTLGMILFRGIVDFTCELCFERRWFGTALTKTRVSGSRLSACVCLIQKRLSCV
jgi:hypothetical protein